MTPQKIFTLLIISLGLLSSRAEAIRPFVTDDARVVGRNLAQLETWVHVHSTNFQHWVLPAYGPTDWLELSMGFLHGTADHDATKAREYSLSGPLVQAKALLFTRVDSLLPSLALSGGSNFSGGFGALRPQETSPYGYLAMTWNIKKELLLIHANLGAVKASTYVKSTWGIGAQLRIYQEWNAIAEIFSSDPYADKDSGGATQVGVRYILSDAIQLDASYGIGVWGRERMPYWLTFGFRGVI